MVEEQGSGECWGQLSETGLQEGGKGRKVARGEMLLTFILWLSV